MVRADDARTRCRANPLLHGSPSWLFVQHDTRYNASMNPTNAQPFRLLVVDDAVSTLVTLRARLELEGYAVWLAPSGELALDLIQQSGLPHLALVDSRLAGMGGMAFCRQARALGHFPIIMLTEQAGTAPAPYYATTLAEEFLPKPYQMVELAARIHHLLQRFYPAEMERQSRVVVDERLELDLARQQARIDARVIELTSVECRILAALLGANGRIVNAQLLLNQVWPDGPIDNSALRVNIYRLRHKLEIDPSHPRYLVSQRSVGYAFRRSNAPAQ